MTGGRCPDEAPDVEFRGGAAPRDDHCLRTERRVVPAAKERDSRYTPGWRRTCADASTATRAGINRSVEHASDDKPVDTRHNDVAVNTIRNPAPWAAVRQ